MSSHGRYAPENLIDTGKLKHHKGDVIQLVDKLSDPSIRAAWESDILNSSKLKIVDLFCGAGGMSEGFVNAGFTVAAAFDHDSEACNTFRGNIPASVFPGDIEQVIDASLLLKNIGATAITVIVGGPPCQGFSHVGRARIQSLDPKNQAKLFAKNELHTHFFRFVENLRPTFFVMENVPALINFESGAYMDAIMEISERLGYKVVRQILNAVDYGVPQNRRRLIVVGAKEGYTFDWPDIIPTSDRVTLEQAIGDLPFVEPPSLIEQLDYDLQKTQSSYQKYMRNKVRSEDKPFVYDHVVRPAREDDIIIFSNMKPGQKYTDVPPQYRRYNSASFTDKYYMLKPDSPGITITAHLSKDGYRYIHYDPKQHRTISVREAARTQSFGDHFRFAGSRSSRFRQIGNAVPPLLAENIARQIQKAIHNAQEKQQSSHVEPFMEHFSYLNEGSAAD